MAGICHRKICSEYLPYAMQTQLAKLDFETYSEAGYVWYPELKKWKSIQRNKTGLAAVGAAAYS